MMTESNKITKAGNPNLPFGYIADFLLYLRETNHTFLTYKGLTRSSYLNRVKLDEEYRNWHLKNILSPNKYVLIHYDIDANVDIMHDLIRFHVKYKIPASCTVFNKRIFDSVYKKTGKIVYDETYNLDFLLLQDFINIGGCVGYHCNAAERSLFNLGLAKEIIEEDLDELTKLIPISYFTMHGGPVGPNGLSNSTLTDIDYILRKFCISWVHNGQSLSFDYLWDDGSAGRPSYKFSIGDPALITSMISPGQRARFLFHPQYYKSFADDPISHIHQQEYSWFKGILSNHENALVNTNFHAQNRDLPFSTVSSLKRLLKKIYWLFFGKILTYLFPKKYLNPIRDASIRPRKFEVPDSGFLDYFATQISNYKPISVSRSSTSVLSSSSKSIFVHGMSRSGTTLLCSVLNSHPDIAMGYELYPSLLSKNNKTYYDCLEILFYLRNLDPTNIFNELHALGLEKISRFAACVGHSGLSVSDIADVLWYCSDSKLRIVDEASILMLYMHLSSVKCYRESKSIWGAKASGNPDLYKSCFPNSSYVYIVRDPRSIYYSQKTNGSFDPQVAQLFTNWSKKYQYFMRLAADQKTIIVKYEDLVLNPESVLRRLCNYSGISFSKNMMSHSDSSNTLHLNPRGQLSAERVAKPIDQSSLYAWKKLPKHVLAEFDEISEGLLDDYWSDI